MLKAFFTLHPTRFAQSVVLPLWGLPSLYFAFFVPQHGHPPAVIIVVPFALAGLLFHGLFAANGWQKMTRAGRSSIPHERDAQLVRSILRFVYFLSLTRPFPLSNPEWLVMFVIMILPFALAGHVII